MDQRTTAPVDPGVTIRIRGVMGIPAMLEKSMHASCSFLDIRERSWRFCPRRSRSPGKYNAVRPGELRPSHRHERCPGRATSSVSSPQTSSPAAGHAACRQVRPARQFQAWIHVPVEILHDPDRATRFAQQEHTRSGSVCPVRVAMNQRRVVRLTPLRQHVGRRHFCHPHQVRPVNSEVLAAAELHFVHREEALAVQWQPSTSRFSSEPRSIESLAFPRLARRTCRCTSVPAAWSRLRRALQPRRTAGRGHFSRWCAPGDEALAAVSLTVLTHPDTRRPRSRPGRGLSCDVYTLSQRPGIPLVMSRRLTRCSFTAQCQPVATAKDMFTRLATRPIRLRRCVPVDAHRESMASSTRCRRPRLTRWDSH